MARLTISLTSIPPRFATLGPVLQGLAAQGADDVQLWLPEAYTRFPGWDGTLPDVPAGVTLRRCRADLGPATKLLPALGAVEPGDRLIICDDDTAYGPGWAEALTEASNTDPGTAIAASTYALDRLALSPRPRARHMVVQGFAGVLIAPAMISARRIDPRDAFVDDIWLSAQLAASGTRIVEAPTARALVTPLPSAAIAPLQTLATGGLNRADANLRSAEALRAELGIWD